MIDNEYELSVIMAGLVLHFASNFANERCMTKLFKVLERFEDEVATGTNLSIALCHYFDSEKKIIEKYYM